MKVFRYLLILLVVLSVMMPMASAAKHSFNDVTTPGSSGFPTFPQGTVIDDTITLEDGTYQIVIIWRDPSLNLRKLTFGYPTPADDTYLDSLSGTDEIGNWIVQSDEFNGGTSSV
ncbi:MAG: hypothetical protein R2741_12880 [Methanolobus sp.]